MEIKLLDRYENLFESLGVDFLENVGTLLWIFF